MAASHAEAAMTIRYRVELSETERTEIQTMLSGGKHAVRKLKRAQILLASDAGQSAETIAASVAVSASTVGRTKRLRSAVPLRRGQSGAGAQRGGPPRGRPQALGPGGGVAGRNRLLKPARGPRPLDARTAGRRNGAPDPARQPLARHSPTTAGRERTQALAGEDVVCPAGGRRVRRAHGGRARSLCRATRSQVPGGVPGREPAAVDRRDTPAGPGRAGAAGAL